MLEGSAHVSDNEVISKKSDSLIRPDKTGYIEASYSALLAIVHRFKRRGLRRLSRYCLAAWQ